MKKFLLSFVILVYVASQQAFSQNCAFTSPNVVQTNAVTVGSDCKLTFQITFNIDYNGGFKYLFIHIWENSRYNFWHVATNNLYSGLQSQPEYNDGSSDPLNILQDALFTVPIQVNNDQTITVLTAAGSYGPDPDAPQANFTGTATSVFQIATNDYLVTITGLEITIPAVNIPTMLPLGCLGANLFNGDTWGSNGNSANAPVQCVQQNITLLPVKFVSFNAERKGQNVELNWQTASEENNLGFDVERLVGNGSWQKIGFVPSLGKSGSSHTTLNYQYTDVNNLTRGVSQYRLKQIDIDRRSTNSAIKLVQGMDQKSKTLVFPNPSNDGKVNVMFDDENMVRNVSVVDINGRTIKQWKGVTGSNIQMENLPAGIYTIRIINAKTNQQTVEKFIVSKR